MEPTTPIDESGSQSVPDPAWKPSCKPKCRCRLCKASRERAKEAVNGPARGKSTKAKTAPAVMPPQPALVEEKIMTDPGPEVGLEEVMEGNPVFITNRRSRRDRVAEWVLMRSQGMRTHEIAAKMGIKPGTLSTLISKATREGWLKFDSPADRLEYELAPLVVDNVRSFLDAKDRQVTLEAAKGLGLFKSHQSVKVEGEQAPTVIALRIDISEPTVPREGGTIVGAPKLPMIEGTASKD